MWFEETLVQLNCELDILVCSNCHVAVRKEYLINDMQYMNFCPNCGEDNRKNLSKLVKKSQGLVKDLVKKRSEE